jgi:F-type H+-transporting ATPase subunit a
VKGCLVLIGVILLTVLSCGVSSGFLNALGISALLDPLAQPVLPTIQLPPETIPADGVITNTQIATVFADIVILLLFGLGLRRLRRNPDDLVPRSRWQNLLEMWIEALYNLADSVLGRKARTVFWLGATFFIFIMVANWMELIPGFDSIGIIEEAHEGVTGYEKGAVLGISALVGPLPEDSHDHGYVLRPFLRAANTDLNTTLALALISVILVQFYGMRELGVGEYLTGRFIQIRRLNQGNPLGLIDLFVGTLEIVGEIARIISFSFRLFGNIFAGQVLLFVIMFLFPFIVYVVLIFWGLEIFVGAIQALVFMMLTFVFIATAMVHHGEEHEEEH